MDAAARDHSAPQSRRVASASRISIGAPPRERSPSRRGPPRTGESVRRTFSISSRTSAMSPRLRASSVLRTVRRISLAPPSRPRLAGSPPTPNRTGTWGGRGHRSTVFGLFGPNAVRTARRSAQARSRRVEFVVAQRAREVLTDAPDMHPRGRADQGRSWSVSVVRTPRPSTGSASRKISPRLTRRSTRRVIPLGDKSTRAAISAILRPLGSRQAQQDVVLRERDAVPSAARLGPRRTSRRRDVELELGDVMVTRERRYRYRQDPAPHEGRAPGWRSSLVVAARDAARAEIHSRRITENSAASPPLSRRIHDMTCCGLRLSLGGRWRIELRPLPCQEGRRRARPASLQLGPTESCLQEFRPVPLVPSAP
jgi:hypothetical protein